MRPSSGERVQAAVDDALALGRLCQEAMARTRDALANGDELLARRVVAGDDAIDDATRRLEADVLSILAMAAPLAGDLRRVVAVFKSLSELERYGDYAVHAARAVEGHGGRDAPAEVAAMAAEAEAMLGTALSALGREDVAMARAVALRDRHVDRLCARVRRRLERPGVGAWTLSERGRWIFAARSLERAADHAVHVAEWAVYAAVGERPAVGAP